MNCFNCGTAISFTGRVGTRDTCPQCDADAHTCLNCEFYDRSAPNECREPQAEWVRAKEKANRCDWFRPATKARSGTGSGSKAVDAKKKFDDLFG